MTPSPHALLRAVLRARLPDPAWQWLDHTARTAAGDGLPNAYTAAPKHAGRAALALAGDEQRDLAAAAPGVDFARWTVDDAARAVLLLSLADRGDDAAFSGAATNCFECGDAREQQSWLRAVSLLPQPERFLALVIEACRTNIVPVFESIACENPYPGRYFPERNFNQLVLKALFNNIALQRIVALPARLNSELTRMAGDYAAERRAAGRPVPADIALAMTNRGTPEELAQ
jgi:hypothetical protein